MTFTWEAGRQLATATNSGTTTAYTYSSSGVRTSKTVGNITTKYSLSGTQVIKASTGSTWVLYYYDESGSPVAFRTNESGTAVNYYYVKNLQGDIVAIANSNGTKVVEYTYNAWGKVLTTTGSLAGTIGASNPYRYRGYWFDTETGLYYLQSRYYDPQTGRFINADGFVSTGQGIFGCNMFAYCENNPVNRIDYNGQFWEELWDAFIEAVQQASGTFAVAGGVTQLDSPIPGPADLIGGAIAGVTLIGCLCIATYSAIVSSKSIISTSKENSSEQVITDTGSNPTYIYRHNGTNPGNLVPTDNDVFFSSGLSFSTVPKRNSWRTTVDAINSTGVLRAVVDGPTHVSVYPVGGTVEGWKREGTTSIWTRTLMTISIKMR